MLINNEVARKLQHLCRDIAKDDFDPSVIKDRFLEVKDVTQTGMPPLIAAVTSGRLIFTSFVRIGL
jgi:hypothetical protein